MTWWESVILIGQSFFAIPAINDAAIDEARLENEVLHDAVVAVSVNAKGGITLQGEMQNRLEDALHFSRTGDAMDGGVWAMVGPGALFNYIVGRVVPSSQEEGGHNFSMVDAHVAVAALNVGGELLPAGIAFGPLMRVAGGYHKASGGGKDFPKSGNIFQRCRADENVVGHGRVMFMMNRSLSLRMSSMCSMDQRMRSLTKGKNEWARSVRRYSTRGGTSA